MDICETVGAAETATFGKPTLVASAVAAGNRSPSILLVEGAARGVMRGELERDAFAVQAVEGKGALEAVASHPFDLVLLRVDGAPGLELCRRLRAASSVRIFMLLSSDDSHDRIVGLEFGADDVLVEPVSARELASRIRAAMRRRELNCRGPRLRTLGSVTIDITRQAVEVDGTRTPLTSAEFRILALLSEEPGRIYTRSEIVRLVGRSEAAEDRRSCDYHIMNLRRKLTRDPGSPLRISTVRGVGYTLAGAAG